MQAVKKLGVFLLGLFVANVGPLSGQDTSTALLTETEAFEIIAARESAAEAKKLEQRLRIESAYVEEEFVVQEGGRDVILRRVAKPLYLADKTEASAPELETTLSAPAPFLELSENFTKNEFLSISVTNYDDQHSKIVWRDGADVFEVWTNVATQYLRVLHTFEFGGYSYNHLGFVDHVSAELEAERMAMATALGHAPFETRWKEPPVAFSPDYPEYVVVTDHPETVPEKLYRQIEALLTVYLMREDALRVAYLNQETLEDARKAYREANPAEPEDSVLIMWPEKNSRYQN